MNEFDALAERVAANMREWNDVKISSPDLIARLRELLASPRPVTSPDVIELLLQTHEILRAGCSTVREDAKEQAFSALLSLHDGNAARHIRRELQAQPATLKVPPQSEIYFAMREGQQNGASEVK